MGADRGTLLGQTADIVASYVAKTSVPVGELPQLIRQVHAVLAGIAATRPKREPFVPIKKSVTPNYVICLECGRKAQMLKRHLSLAHDLTPDEYRQKWKLPSNYPIVAPKYARQRSEMAKKRGLGRKPKKGRRKKR